MTQQFTITKKAEVAVTKIRASFGVRYWEDATVNGQEDEDGTLIPLRAGDRWVIEVDLASGKIANWPEGVQADTHYKVCDDGEYQLIDVRGDVVATYDTYVPGMFAPLDDGFGDYVILNIDGTGQIKGWKADLSYFEGRD
jgi:hypothetical protein